jgi:hypothetical protein
MIVRKGETKIVDNPVESVSVEPGGTIIIKRAKYVYCEEGSKYALDGGDNSCETLYADEQSIDITNINKLANFGD